MERGGRKEFLQFLLTFQVQGPLLISVWKRLLIILEINSVHCILKIFKMCDFSI